MYGRKSVKYFLFLIIFLFISVNCFADKSDYFVGLKAYKDGFYDVAKISLEDFIKTADKNSDKIYSEYLLYLIYSKENNKEKAKYYFNLIKDIDDERFDQKALKQDKIRILLEEDCDKAVSMILNKPDKVYLSMYAASKCPVTDNISDLYYKTKGLSTNVKLNIIAKIEDKPETVAKIFNTLNLKKLKIHQLEYFGDYFFVNKNYDMFWKVYQNHKTDKFVNLALDRLWEIKEYKNYVRSYEYNKDNYKISSANTCRAVKAYQTLKRSYDCDLIDSCFADKKDKSFYVSKLGCIMEKNSKDDIVNFLSSMNKKDINYICDFTEYLVANDFYNEKILPSFSGCKQSSKIADILMDKDKADDIIKLFENSNDDNSNYYVCLAYIMKKDYKNAKIYMEKVKDEKLKKDLSEYF